MVRKGTETLENGKGGKHWHIWVPKANQRTLETWSLVKVAKPFQSRSAAQKAMKTQLFVGKDNGSDMGMMMLECKDGNCAVNRRTAQG